MHSGYIARSSLLSHLFQLEQHLRVKGDQQHEGDQAHQEEVQPHLKVTLICNAECLLKDLD